MRFRRNAKFGSQLRLELAILAILQLAHQPLPIAGPSRQVAEVAVVLGDLVALLVVELLPLVLVHRMRVGIRHEALILRVQLFGDFPDLLVVQTDQSLVSTVA